MQWMCMSFVYLLGIRYIILGWSYSLDFALSNTRYFLSLKYSLPNICVHNIFLCMETFLQSAKVCPKISMQHIWTIIYNNNTHTCESSAIISFSKDRLVTLPLNFFPKKQIWLYHIFYITGPSISALRIIKDDLQDMHSFLICFPGKNNIW